MEDSEVDGCFINMEAGWGVVICVLIFANLSEGFLKVCNMGF